MKLAMERRPRDLMDLASVNPEQLTSTPTKQDLRNEEIHKLAMKAHLEVQQREDIRRDLAEGMKCVLLDLRAGEQVFIAKKIRAKFMFRELATMHIYVVKLSLNGTSLS